MSWVRGFQDMFADGLCILFLIPVSLLSMVMLTVALWSPLIIQVADLLIACGCGGWAIRKFIIWLTTENSPTMESPSDSISKALMYICGGLLIVYIVSRIILHLMGVPYIVHTLIINDVQGFFYK